MKLYDPIELKGKYLGRVLASKHLTGGRAVEDLRTALAEHFNVSRMRIVLGNAATNCFQGLVDYLYQNLSCGESIGWDWRPAETWPLMKNIVARKQLRTGLLAGAFTTEARVFTDIGGSQSSQMIKRQVKAVVGPTKKIVIHDACPGWEFEDVSDYWLA
jgi:hypothetical protein